jgi:hypothetical protein
MSEQNGTELMDRMHFRDPARDIGVPMGGYATSKGEIIHK